MSSRFSKRCIVCGALIITVTASGLIFHHEHTHQDGPASAPRPTRTLAASSSSTTAVPGGIVFGAFPRSTSS